VNSIVTMNQSMGVGGARHVIMELMSSLAGIQLTHVPYKTGALVDVIGGQVQLTLEPATTALEQIKAGAVIPLGTTGKHRLPALPNVPTIAADIAKWGRVIRNAGIEAN
jgi:tripartite-type tricarboxylate transporter receptor subunit TctC